jgi:hypothetical protein
MKFLLGEFRAMKIRTKYSGVLVSTLLMVCSASA